MAFGVRRDKVQIDVEINGKKVQNNIRDLNKAYRQLNKEIQTLTPGTAAFIKKAKELGAVKNKLDEARGAARAFQKSQGLMAKGFGQIKLAIKSMLASFLPLLAFSEILGQLKAAFDMSQEVQKTKEEINRFLGETGPGLEATTAQLLGISRTFEVELNAVLKAGNAAMQEFGTNSSETFGLIEKGLLATGKEGDEFLDQVREYSAQLSDLGFTAEQSFSFIAGSIQDGVFNDSAADSLKELRLRIGDLTKSQKEVLAINFGDEFANQVASGELSSVESLAQIGKKLNELRENGENITPVISNIFGGPGENAGEKFILSLQNIDRSFDDLIDTTNVYTKRQLELLESEKLLGFAQSELAFQLEGSGASFKKVGNLIRTFFNLQLAKMIEYFKFLPQRIRVSVEQLKNIFGGNEQGVLDAQESLFAAIRDDRTNFAEAQEQERLKEINKQAEAERLLRLRQQKRINKEVSEQASKDAQKAQELLEQLRIQAMEDGLEKEIAQVKLNTQKRIDALKGNASQITEQSKLLKDIELQEIAKIEQKYRDKEEKMAQDYETQERLRKKKPFDDDLKLLKEAKEQEAALAIQQAQQQLVSGEDPLLIDQQLKADLLAAEIEFLEDKAELQNLFGISSVETQKQIEKQKLAAAKTRINKENELESLKKDKAKELGGQLVSALSGLSDALNQRQLAKLEERQQKELSLAGDNEAKIAKVNEKFAKLKEKAQKNAAIKQKAVSATQTIINTAESIVKTGAQLGYPAAVPFQVLAGAIGATNLATILAQKFAGGGATGKAPFGIGRDASGHRPVGVVHENEWVAPAFLYQDPAYSHIFDTLEAARLRGFASGGAVDTTPADTAVTAAASSQTETILREELVNLRRDFNRMHFVTVWTEKEAQQNQDLQNEMDARKSLGNF